MAIGLLQEFEASVDQYNEVHKKVHPEDDPPAGLIMHCGGEIDGGKVRVWDVWESQAKFDEFMESRLGPAIAEAMGPDTKPDKFEVIELIDLTIP
jgi:hypothetical protein